jgi:hypothetical protein
MCLAASLDVRQEYTVLRCDSIRKLHRHYQHHSRDPTRTHTARGLECENISNEEDFCVPGISSTFAVGGHHDSSI